MSDEDGNPTLSDKAISRYGFSLFFLAWAGGTVLIYWIVRGGQLYATIASKFPVLEMVRNTLLSYFTKPYVF